MPAVSIVVPVRNEADNIAPLIAEIDAALDGRFAYEIVYVDDGSTDATARTISALMARRGNLRQISHARSSGQSAAVRSGVRAARGAHISIISCATCMQNSQSSKITPNRSTSSRNASQSARA